MASIVTSAFRKRFMQDIIQDVKLGANSEYSTVANNTYYFVVGKPSKWGTDDSVVPNAVDTPDDINKFNTEILYGKRIYDYNLAFMIPKTKWTSGTVYAQYDNTDATLFSKQFFVVNSYNRVYKCLFNNNGSPSTVEPNELSVVTDPFDTADGYVWKYMYTLSEVNNAIFYSLNYMPVDANTTIEDAAVPGTIDIIKIDTKGSGYKTTANVVQEVISATTFRIANDAVAENFYYNYSDFFITNGPGFGDIATISDYIANGSGRYVVVDTALPFVDSSSTYRISPKVVIDGDGFDARAYCTVEANTNGIEKVVVINAGHDYSFANVYVSANTLYGSGATLSPVIAPPGGHGSDAVSELGAKSLCISVTFANNEFTNFTSNISFRQAGIILNPRDSADDTITYSSNSFSGFTTLAINRGVVTFNDSEVVRGLTSTANGQVIFSNSSVMYISGISKQFMIDETIVGLETGATATVLDVTNPDIAKGLHDVLYIDNFENIVRAPTSSEQVKLFITF